MAPHKAGRTDEIVWEPPLLYIKVERHGGIALGGTRAEIQQWVLNVENCTASADLIGHRQLMPMAPRWDAVRAAQELRDPILSGADHPALRWTKGTRSEVTVILKNVVPDSYKQTAAGRRKRLRTALEAELSAHGWKPVPDKPGAVFRL